jgi:gamma-glutamylcyclotransferase (GGCT)/AIG2-like uncharacterized protein YtfP
MEQAEPVSGGSTYSLDRAMNVFTYGSLMFPEVWERVVRGAYSHAVAAASGFRCYAVQGETYPGMIAADGAASPPDRVEGIVYFDVSLEDLAALDSFEGGDYRRVEIAASLPDGTSVNASAYLYLPQEKLAPEPWSRENFQLKSFLRSYCGLP